MKLIYQGSGVIPNIPARDLEPQDIQDIAQLWGKSLAETEGLLISSKAYKPEDVAKSNVKAKAPLTESEES